MGRNAHCNILDQIIGNIKKKFATSWKEIGVYIDTSRSELLISKSDLIHLLIASTSLSFNADKKVLTLIFPDGILLLDLGQKRIKKYDTLIIELQKQNTICSMQKGSVSKIYFLKKQKNS